MTIFNLLFTGSNNETIKLGQSVALLVAESGGIQMQLCQDLGQIFLKIWTSKAELHNVNVFTQTKDGVKNLPQKRVNQD